MIDVDYSVKHYKHLKNDLTIVTKCHYAKLNYTDHINNWYKPIIQFIYNNDNRGLKINTIEFLWKDEFVEFGKEISEQEFQEEFEKILFRLKDEVINNSI